MKKLLSLILLTGFTLISQAQPFTWIQNDGIISYTSNFPPQDLHFFMFDDGFYKKSKFPVHFYTPGAHETTLYTVGNKQGDDPRGHSRTVVVNNHNNTGPNPHRPLNIKGTIEARPSWNITKDYFGMLLLEFQNDFSSLTSDGCITLEYDPEKLNVTVNPDPRNWASLENHQSGVILWTYSGLKPNEQRVLYLTANSLNLSLGTMNYSLIATLSPNCTEPIVSISKHTTSTVPHDPNVKSVTNRDYLAETILSDPNMVTQKVIYRVQFHNDGDGFAKDVMVIDEIHPKADASTFEFLGSSHPCTYSVQMDQVTVDFDDIYLPGIGQHDPATFDYDETVGYYEYSICISDPVGLPLGRECLPTTAAIFFDTLSPVLAHNSLCTDDTQPYEQPCGTNGQDFNGSHSDNRKAVISELQTNHPTIKIYPNPVSNYLNVTGLLDAVKLYVLNESGLYQTISPKKQGDGTVRIDLQHLSRGFYVLVIQHECEPVYKSFVKM